MDLLIEKGDKRTYLSRYKVITTSFEESSPSVKRNNTQIQYRNGNVDFGGWNEAKMIDYVGYYRADDLEDEEYLRERIYALLSDPEGYYVTQLKNDNDNSFERPGETSGDYFDKQVNRPSHKRFYVYASSLESELVGSYGSHVLYKISAKFTTMKLPYGESVPRDLDIKPNVPYYGENLYTDTKDFNNSSAWNSWGGFVKTGAKYDGLTVIATDGNWTGMSQTVQVKKGDTYTYSAYARYESGTGTSMMFFNVNGSDTGTVISLNETWQRVVYTVTMTNDGLMGARIDRTNNNTNTLLIAGLKLERGTTATPWSPAPEDPDYNEWYSNTYYNTKNLVIPYAGTVPCNQLEQGFTVEFTAKQSGSNLKISLNGTDFIATGDVYSGDIFKLSGYEYLRNSISIVKATNKAYFKLLPGVTNKISSSIAGTIRILDYQDLYA